MTYAVALLVNGTAEALPSWLSYTTDASGALVFNAAAGSSAVIGQSFDIQLTATNPATGLSATTSFTANVVTDTPPIVTATSAPVYHVRTGEAFSAALASSVYFSDADVGNTVSVALSGTLPPGLSIDNSNPGVAWINGTVPSGTPAGIYTLTLTGTDQAGATVSRTVTLDVAAPNAIASQSLSPGQSFTIPGTTFIDPYHSAMSYSATLSGGAALPAGMGFSGSGTLSIGAVTAGTYTLTVTAADAYGGSSGTNWSVTVNNVAPTFSAAPSNVNAIVGSAFSETVPAATDANGDALTYTAGMANGSSWVALPSWASFNASTRTFTGTPTSTGTWTFAYWANDGHGGVTGQSFTVTATLAPNLPPTYNGTIPSTVSIVSGQSYKLPANSFTSPYGQTLTYSALDASTGSTLPTWVTFNPSTQTFATTSSKLERTVSIKVIATDPSGRTASDTFTLDAIGTSTNSVSLMSASTLSPTSSSSSLTTTTTQTTTTNQTTTPTPNTQAEWFTYDADNRVVIANGQLVGGAVTMTAGGPTALPSYENSYDAAGNVVSVESIDGNNGTDLMARRFSYDLRGERTTSWHQVDLTTGGASLGIDLTQQYDAAGRLLATEQYYKSGTLEKYYDSGEAIWITVDISGWMQSAQDTAYNADGQVTAQASYARPTGGWYQLDEQKILNGTLTVAAEETVPSPLPAPGAANFGQLSLTSATTQQTYDAEGNLTGYS